MSYAADINDEDQPENQEPGKDLEVSLGGGGSGVASAGGGNVGAGGQPVPTPKADKPSSSGSWTNLQSYLDANQDQAAQAGSQIAGSVSNQAKAAKDDVDSASSEFSNLVNSNTVQANPDQVSQAIEAAKNAKAGSTLDPSLISGYQSQANASYNGPSDFTSDQNYSKAQSDLTRAQNSLSESQSEAGRDVLLNQQYSGASQYGYNPGEKNLDQALIEGNPDSQAAFQNLQNQWSGIGNILNSATSNENALAAKAAATNAKTVAQAKAAYQAANSGFQNTLNSNYQNSLSSYQAALDSAKKDTASNKLTQAEAQEWGLTNGERTYGLNLSNYLNPGVAPTLANTATADQYAQALALAELAGQTDSAFLPGSEASQAGTAAPQTFNTTKFNSDVSGAKSAADEHYQDMWNAPSAEMQSYGFNSYADADAFAQFMLAQPAVPTVGNTILKGQHVAQSIEDAINQWKAEHEYNAGTVGVG